VLTWLKPSGFAPIPTIWLESLIPRASRNIQFEPAGVFRFEKGKTGCVEIGNQHVDGYVIIDAVQWLLVKE